MAYIENPITLKGIVVKGYQVASGRAADSPYPDGTIKMQIPFFKQLGLDLTGFYLATLNICIEPLHIKLCAANYHFERLCWTDIVPAETFSFVNAQLAFAAKGYNGFWYYPHPETKVNHHHNDQLFEFIGPEIPDIGYGSQVCLKLNASQIELSE